MYELAKKARAGMKSKAERLAGEKDRKTDSSDWSPAEPLNADVKTGMRPVSRRAYKNGGKVADCAPMQRADRKARKAGGRVEEKKGEQPLVDRYINRDLKKANEYRDGKKHVGALKHGGRAAKASGGSMTMEEMIKKHPAPAKPTFRDKSGNVPLPPRRPANVTTAAPNKMDPSKYITGDDITGPPKKVRKDGGRAKREDGGGIDPRLGIVSPKMLQFGQNEVTPGLKSGGRTGKAFGGSAEFKKAFRAARNAYMAGEGPKNFEFKGKSYSTDLMKVPTPPERPAPRMEKKITVEFGKPSGMPKTDQMGNPNPGMKRGGRMKKEDGGPARAAGAAATQALANAPSISKPTPSTNIPPVSSGILPKSPTNYTKPPAYDPDKYNPKPADKFRKGISDFLSRVKNPTAAKKGGRVAKQIGGALSGGMAAAAPGASMNPMTRMPNPSGGMYKTQPYPVSRMPSSSGTYQTQPYPVAPQPAVMPQPFTNPGGQRLPDAAVRNAQGRPFQPGGKFAPQPMQMGPGFPGGPSLGQPQPLTSVGGGPTQVIGGQVGPMVDDNGPMGTVSSSPYLAAPMPTVMARKDGGRIARASGGKATSKGKGKTNINIIIATGAKKEPESMLPLPPPAPMGMPPMPAPPAPNAAPMGIPPMPMPPMGGGQPPMPGGFKRGGRISKVAHSYKDMTAGAGSGEGRLQKTDIAKRSAHKAGGKVYRSYRDMDAGAGSGKGRLEKTEIQSRKK